MSSQDLTSSWDAARSARREDAARYAATLFVSILLHLLLVLLAIWLGFRAPEESEQEIEVPIVFEEPTPPESLPPLPQEQPQARPEPEPQSEQEKQEEEIPEDASLLGFNSSEGEIEARPTRPQGPEKDVKAPPAPVEQEAPSEIRPVETEPEPEPLEEAQEAEEELEVPDEGDPADPNEPPEPNPALDTLPPVTRESPDPGEAPENARPNESAPRAGREPLPFPPLPERRPPPPRRPSRRPGELRRVPDFDVDVTGGLWADNIKFDSKDYNWEEYSTKLYFAVYRAWLRELLGRVRRFERDQILNDLTLIEGQASIRFTIQRDGAAEGVMVVDPSVIPTLDEASRAAIERAVIPPLPIDFPRDSEGVTFRFVISGFETAAQIERQLKYLQYRGEF